MAYDGLFTKKMVESLQFLTTGRVHKINQPDNDTILMVVRQNRQNHQLLLSIHPNLSRLQLTTKNMIIHLIHPCLRVFLENT